MLYIVGFTFQFKSHSPVATQSISIQERIANSKRKINQSQFDSRFLNGATYKLSRISKINNSEFRYMFTNLSVDNIQDIDVIFPSTAAGDDYIAALTNSKQQLNDIRNSIIATQDNES